MSTDNVKRIIVKAVTDLEYRELLLTDPTKAIAGQELTEDETASLKGLSREKFNAAAGELEDRISRAGISLPGSDVMFNPQPDPPGVPLDLAKFFGHIKPSGH